MEVSWEETFGAEGGSVVEGVELGDVIVVVVVGSGVWVLMGRRKLSGTGNLDNSVSLPLTSPGVASISPMNHLVRSFSPSVPIVSTISLILFAASSVQTSSLSARAG